MLDTAIKIAIAAFVLSFATFCVTAAMAIRELKAARKRDRGE